MPTLEFKGKQLQPGAGSPARNGHCAGVRVHRRSADVKQWHTDISLTHLRFCFTMS